MLLCILLLIILILVACHIKIRFGKMGRMLNKIPGPQPLPFFGNMLMFNIFDPNQFWEKGHTLVKKYYPIMKLWYTRCALICAAHPDDVEVLLTNQMSNTKGYAYEYLHPWLKSGLLTSNGEKWRQRRKILTPAFHYGILRKYLEITNEQGIKLIESLKKEGKETVKDLIPFCSNYTLNIICESTMGVALDKMDSNIVDKYKEAVHNMGFIVFYRLPRPYILNWMMNSLWKIGRLQNNALKTLHDFTDKVVKERREYHKITGDKYLNDYLKNEESVCSNSGQKKRLAMLDLLLAAEKSGLIDGQGIKEEVDTFIFEGHDTSGMAMTFTLMLLAENKEAQNKAREEVTDLMNRTDGKLEFAELQELNYLERCIKESLRLFPPVPTLMRYTYQDLQLKNALVPGDTDIIIPTWDTHRDPNFWPDAEKFDPDRFLPERSKDRHPFAYVPFSAGPRNCIGQKLAILELKSLFARILYDFYLEPIGRSCDIKLIADIVLRPVDPIYVKFIKIKE